MLLTFAACGGGGLRSACVDNTACTDSYCNGTWPEGGHCKRDADCSGYEAKALGYSPPAPNKRCIKNVCHQVGFCSRDHS